MIAYKTISRPQLSMIATQNPVTCARYFQRVMEIIVDVLLDLDEDNRCPKGNIGFFEHSKSTIAFATPLAFNGNWLAT
ncbi:hypothetical protein PR002_g14516 [Phytophthora rubi]|uniref:Uncharacterized protein n=1 Tax=Phytophthora rubi TaxID=129364 RepID=A0A6A3L5W7_9STRA|nr:hypothetical protein PR002_g14516 [Phytophthora rubi]